MQSMLEVSSRWFGSRAEDTFDRPDWPKRGAARGLAHSVEMRTAHNSLINMSYD